MALFTLGRFLLIYFLAMQSISLAQESSSGRFEVASIRRSAPNEQWGYDIGHGERVVFNDFLVRELVQFAWHTQAFRIASEPSWLETEHYDIQAKTEGIATEDAVRIMLRALLTERFRLSIRHEKKESPIYTLVQAKSGSKLIAAKQGACTPLEAYSGPQPPPGTLVPPICGVRQFLRTDAAGVQFMQLQETGVTLAFFAKTLGNILDRQAEDATGISGVFDILLEYAPDDHLAVQSSPDRPLPDTIRPALFTALEEQLGLRLAAGRGPVDVLVIDHIGKPTEN
jgi:uncharacterized protein (TIGR03435 family)